MLLCLIRTLFKLKHMQQTLFLLPVGGTEQDCRGFLFDMKQKCFFSPAATSEL